MCTACGKWIHRPKQCSGIKGSLGKVQKFECSVRKVGITEQDALGWRIGNNTSFKRVETFCYLRDMLSSDGGCDHVVLARVNKAWIKFRELKSVLCAKGSLNVKGKAYGAYVRSCMIYGGETWAMSVENMRKLERTEMRMPRLMCAV